MTVPVVSDSAKRRPQSVKIVRWFCSFLFILGHVTAWVTSGKYSFRGLGVMISNPASERSSLEPFGGREYRRKDVKNADRFMRLPLLVNKLHVY